MPSCSSPELVVTGIGITSAIGQGKAEFTAALLGGRHDFSVMQRAGRQSPDNTTRNLGAEIAHLAMPESIPAAPLRTASYSAQVAVATLHEAWHEARLHELDPCRIGLVVGGSNFQQRELALTHLAYAQRLQFLRPSYGMSFMDSDLCGLCSDLFNIRAFAYTVGGASASGQLAAIQAVHAVQSGQADVCIALGALMDLSYWECQGFRAMGAMGSVRFSNEPSRACRPFDQDRDGFIYGECCGALVIENPVATGRRPAAYGRISGWATQMDANRNPNPSVDGEVSVIRGALARAGMSPGDIDYINPHGSGSLVGDETELEAILACGLTHAYINATKSIVGHGLSAAGVVELIATLLQLDARRLHPTANLENPISTAHRWVGREGVSHVIQNALNLSFGFGGINTAVCLQRA